MSNVSLPKFSVLMCVYINDNDEYFRVALESILHKQALLPDELVLVVDGPIDDKKEEIIDITCRNSDVKQVNIVRLEENVGLGAALNTGLNCCKYDYVARMDADDLSREDRFEKQLKFVHEYPEVSVMSGAVLEFGFGDSKVRTVPTSYRGVIKYSRFRSPVNHGSCIYKKNDVIACGGYQSYSQLQDYDLFLTMIFNGYKIINVDDIFVDVRMEDNYLRKSGVKYFKEEVLFALSLKGRGYISSWQALNMIIVRGVPRVLGAKVTSYLYRHILR